MRHRYEGLRAFRRGMCERCALQLLWLSVFHSIASRPAEWFEYSTFLAPGVVPVYSLLARGKTKEKMPHQVHAFADFLEKCRTPATISILFRLVKAVGSVAFHRHGCGQGPRDVALAQIAPDVESIRDALASMNPSIEDLHMMTCNRVLNNVAEYADLYRSVIHVFRCTLDAQALESSRRFSIRVDDTDAEIMRYLVACDILEVRAGRRLVAMGNGL